MARHSWGGRLIVAWIIVFTAISFWSLRETRRSATQGEQARAAICTLKLDLIERVHSSRAFLRGHPNGIPGIPAKTIQASIDNQQRTVDALRIRCR